MPIVYDYLVTFGRGPDKIKINARAYNASDAAVQACVECQDKIGQDVTIPPITKIEPAGTLDSLAEAIGFLKFLKQPKKEDR